MIDTKPPTWMQWLAVTLSEPLNRSLLLQILVLLLLVAHFAAIYVMKHESGDEVVKQEQTC